MRRPHVVFAGLPAIPVAIRLFDRLGNALRDYPGLIADAAGAYSIDIDLGDIAPGVYLVRAEARTAVASTSLVVVR